jgi:hypothetical protein
MQSAGMSMPVLVVQKETDANGTDGDRLLMVHVCETAFRFGEGPLRALNIDKM